METKEDLGTIREVMIKKLREKVQDHLTDEEIFDAIQPVELWEQKTYVSLEDIKIIRQDLAKYYDPIKYLMWVGSWPAFFYNYDNVRYVYEKLGGTCPIPGFIAKYAKQ